jgi:hypothetical protein
MDIKTSKNIKNFECIVCDFRCCKKGEWGRHILTSKHINIMTKYYSMLEASFGYTGVNIKFPVKDELVCLDVKKLINIDNDWIESSVPYTDHLEFMTEKERNKKLTKNRWNTFLCFHSGRTIMSGITADFMRETYYEFLEIIRNCYEDIKEKLIN